VLIQNPSLKPLTASKTDVEARWEKLPRKVGT
jgi:hypothetical protein